MRKLMAVLIAGVFSMGTAFADGDYEEITYDEFEFSTYDVDGDGFLDETEIADIDYVESNFDDWDVDDDGLLSDAEVEDGWLEDDPGDEGLLDV